MSGSPDQKKKMMIGIVAFVAIVGAGGMLAYYYDLFPGSHAAPAGTGAPDISTLPPQVQEDARRQEEARKQDEIKKRPKAGS